jgi:uncharacterized small protein (DUF1192 family)
LNKEEIARKIQSENDELKKRVAELSNELEKFEPKTKKKKVSNSSRGAPKKVNSSRGAPKKVNSSRETPKGGKHKK